MRLSCVRSFGTLSRFLLNLRNLGMCESCQRRLCQFSQSKPLSHSSNILLSQSGFRLTAAQSPNFLLKIMAANDIIAALQASRYPDFKALLVTSIILNVTHKPGSI